MSVADVITLLGYIAAAVVVVPRVPELRRRRVRGRPAVLLVLAGLAVLAEPVATHGPSIVGAPFAAAVLLVAPGAAVTTFRRVGDPLDELVVAVAMSGALLILASGAMVAIGYWNAPLLAALFGTIAGPVLAHRAVHQLLPSTATAGSGP